MCSAFSLLPTPIGQILPTPQEQPTPKQERMVASGRVQTPRSLLYDKDYLRSIRKPQTVAEYFLLLPEGYFTQYGSTTSSVRSFGTRTRRKILSSFSSDTSKMLGVELFTGALEIKNKYLIINTPENSEGYSFSVALWTLKNKKRWWDFAADAGSKAAWAQR